MAAEFRRTALWPIGSRRRGRPLTAWMRFGLLRSQPVSRVFGLDRGQPIDRHYIEKFLSQYQNDVQGRVLEIAGREYTNKFGAGRIVQSDVLHTETGNPEATLVGDLATGAGVPRSAFDCILLTQTLPFIYDVRNAIVHTWDALRPRGVALVTVPGISQISRYDMNRWGDYWRFTDASVRRLFADVFGAENATVTTYGNVLAACAFLHGLAAHELRAEELDYHDPDYQVIIGIRATRPAEHPI
jgi:SAM-dependent methyltransferase